MNHPTGSITQIWLGLFSLALILAIVALLFVWYRRAVLKQSGSGNQIQVLHVKPLGPKDRILVVRVEDRILVLGQTASQLTLLTELDSFASDPNVGGMDIFSGQLKKWVTFRKKQA